MVLLQNNQSLGCDDLSPLFPQCGEHSVLARRARQGTRRATLPAVFNSGVSLAHCGKLSRSQKKIITNILLVRPEPCCQPEFITLQIFPAISRQFCRAATEVSHPWTLQERQYLHQECILPTNTHSGLDSASPVLSGVAGSVWCNLLICPWCKTDLASQVRLVISGAFAAGRGGRGSGLVRDLARPVSTRCQHSTSHID